MKDDGDAVVTEAGIVIGRRGEPAVASMHFADAPSPAAAVAHTGPLLLHAAGDSHISLSAPSTETAGKIATH
jgi:hypothetical protein